MFDLPCDASNSLTPLFDSVDFVRCIRVLVNSKANNPADSSACRSRRVVGFFLWLFNRPL